MTRGSAVRARFFAPPAALACYFTSFYLAEIDLAPGERVVDYLHPEWANLRFASGAPLAAQNPAGHSIADCHFAVTGPSGQAVRFEVGTCRIWGVGLLPLGWDKFIGVAAADMADALLDGGQHPVFASFLPLAQNLFGPQTDVDGELARIGQFFLSRLGHGRADDIRVQAIHAALVDPAVSTVADLAQRSGISARTVERICLQSFGFPPKLLLRRQRFMRSLAQFILDPTLKWIGALDGHYHDQAQFVREFRQFMGMTPREYAKIPHPIIEAIMRERARIAGAAVQALDGPQGASLAAHAPARLMEAAASGPRRKIAQG